MSTTLERLRRLQALRPQRTTPEPELPPPQPAPFCPVGTSGPAQRLEDLVPGAEVVNSAGVCYLRTLHYPLAAERGPVTFGALLTQRPGTFAPFHPNFALHDRLGFEQAVFLDTETTGLAGGAGVYCFMVGIGTFESLAAAALPFSTDPAPPVTHFVLRQFFMRHPGEEGALLLALAEILDQYELSVTFNGRTFDLPLLRTRFQQNQRIYPELRGSAKLLAADRPHLDLLGPARRLWRRRLQSCRLIHLEQMILQLQRSEEDVPGHLIPALYTDYVRTGNARALRGVFYHNGEDILSMVGLAERLCASFGPENAVHEPPTLPGEDWLALGQCCETTGQSALAEQHYRRAQATLRDPQAKAELFARLGQLLKRQGRWAEAAEIWQLWLTSVPGHDPAPFVELAKYCEWQVNDLEQAEMWTAWALHNLRTASAGQRRPGQISELEQRLARIKRKQDGSPLPPALPEE